MVVAAANDCHQKCLNTSHCKLQTAPRVFVFVIEVRYPIGSNSSGSTGAFSCQICKSQTLVTTVTTVDAHTSELARFRAKKDLVRFWTRLWFGFKLLQEHSLDKNQTKTEKRSSSMLFIILFPELSNATDNDLSEICSFVLVWRFKSFFFFVNPWDAFVPFLSFFDLKKVKAISTSSSREWLGRCGRRSPARSDHTPCNCLEVIKAFVLWCSSMKFKCFALIYLYYPGLTVRLLYEKPAAVLFDRWHQKAVQARKARPIHRARSIFGHTVWWEAGKVRIKHMNEKRNEFHSRENKKRGSSSPAC